MHIIWCIGTCSGHDSWIAKSLAAGSLLLRDASVYINIAILALCCSQSCFVAKVSQLRATPPQFTSGCIVYSNSWVGGHIAYN